LYGDYYRVLVYRDGVDFYEPCCLEDGKRGTVDFDTSFSLSTAQQQDYFVSTCDAIMATTCDLAGCADGR
jgi:hypothetical protein